MAGVNALTTEIIARLGNRTDLGARALVWLNDAYFELLLSPRFSFYELEETGTLNLESGENQVVLSPQLGAGRVWTILHLADRTNERRLRRQDARDFDDMVRTGSSGPPLEYCRFGDTLEIWPTADQAYTLNVRYRKRPAELAAGGAHLLGREWDEVLIALAVTKGWEALVQTEKAAAQRQLLEGMLSVREEAFRLDDADAEATIGVAMDGR